MLETYIGLGVISTIAGFILFRGLLFALPRRLSSAHYDQRKEVISEAKRQAESILKNARTQEDEAIEIMEEELKDEIEQEQEALEDLKTELDDQDRYLKSVQKQTENAENKVTKREGAIQIIQQETVKKQEDLKTEQENLITTLTSQTDLQIDHTRQQLQQQILDARTVECQRFLKALEDNFSSEASRNAKRILEKANARYAPTFYWPKHSNTVEAEQKIIDTLQKEGDTTLEELSELSGCQIQPATETSIPMIRLSGGFGIDRESARLALETALQGQSPKWRQLPDLYQNQRQRLMAEASDLGEKAIHQLQLPNIHTELQRLVGALNWRTSYRQNQWHHTVEVATLAGLLASEVGVDPEHAKRCGLLHDIGKALDYNIEGSHAVISGDYADRYGESRFICDAVMSHHDDLIVESPLAWLLRAADTMSGARPGARVNLEEGYQIRLDAISEAAHSFSEVSNLAIMNGGREVHVQVHSNTKEREVQSLPRRLADKIEENVAYPGQIRVVVTRTFESVAVA
ncbi:MAG: Rnase Y domain-containing protein [Oligoflexales bacterium]